MILTELPESVFACANCVLTAGSESRRECGRASLSQFGRSVLYSTMGCPFRFFGHQHTADTEVGGGGVSKRVNTSDSEAYFGNILQKPMWDDDDFQTYFEGHFEMWELPRSIRMRCRKVIPCLALPLRFRCADSRPEVRQAFCRNLRTDSASHGRQGIRHAFLNLWLAGSVVWMSDWDMPLSAPRSGGIRDLFRVSQLAT